MGTNEFDRSLRAMHLCGTSKAVGVSDTMHGCLKTSSKATVSERRHCYLHELQSVNPAPCGEQSTFSRMRPAAEMSKNR